jgi:hypothetical protein
MKYRTTVIAGGTGLVALVVGTALGSSSGTTAKAAPPVPAVTVTKAAPTVTVPGPTVTVPGPVRTVTRTVAPPKPAKPVPATLGFDDGTRVVGAEMPPGIYHTDPAGQDCYWERDKDLTGSLGAIIANDNISGPTTIQVAPTDKAVKFSGGCRWTTQIG